VSARFERRWALLVAGVAALVFLPTLGHGFVFDDRVEVVENTYVRSLEHLPLVFSGNTWAGAGRNNHTYRPVTISSYALNHAISGSSAWSYHLVNVALHVLVSLLFLRLALTWGLSLTAAGLAALLFAVHPVHVEAVTNVAGRKDLLAAAFALLALLAHGRALRRGGAWLALAPLAVAGATLSKETGAVTIALLVARDVLFNRGDWQVSRRRGVVLYAAHAAVLGVCFVVRWRVLGGFGVPHIPFYDNPAVDASTGVRVLTAATVIGRGLLLLLAPVTLSPDYSYAVIPLVTSILDWRFLLTAAAAAALVGLAGVRRRTRAVGLFAILWYGFTILPASNLLLPVGTIFGERLLYLPSLAFCLVAGLLAARACSRLKTLAAVSLVALLVGALGVRTVTYALAWSDEYRLFAWAARAAPRSTKVWLKLGDLRRERGEIESAHEAYRRALAIAPGNDKAKLGLASVLERLGQTSEARRIQQELIDSRPRDPDVWHALGLRFRRQGDLEAAADCWRRALLLNPDHVQSLGDLGSFHIVAGNAAKAATYLERAVAVQPLHPTAWYNLGFLYQRTGRSAEARAAWRRFLSTAGDDLAAERERVRQILSRGE